MIFMEKQALALEEIVVSTAEGKITKEQIASFFKSCYTKHYIQIFFIKSLLPKKRENGIGGVWRNLYGNKEKNQKSVNTQKIFFS